MAIPAGRHQARETPEQAMYRELHEEIGLEPQHVQVLGPHARLAALRRPATLGQARMARQLQAARSRSGSCCAWSAATATSACARPNDIGIMAEGQMDGAGLAARHTPCRRDAGGQPAEPGLGLVGAHAGGFIVSCWRLGHSDARLNCWFSPSASPERPLQVKRAANAGFGLTMIPPAQISPSPAFAPAYAQPRYRLQQGKIRKSATRGHGGTPQGGALSDGRTAYRKCEDEVG